MNGLYAFDKVFAFNRRHVGDSEIMDDIIVDFETTKAIFQNELVTDWQQMATIDFDKARAAIVFRALELGKMYQKWLGWLYRSALLENRLKTMWDFYNLVTWFTTHQMQERNNKLAQQTAAKAHKTILEVA